MLRSVARWFVVVVLTLDAVAAFVFIGGSLLQAEPTAPPVVAATSTLAPATASTPPSAPTPAPAPAIASASAEAKPGPLTIPADTIPGALNPDAPVTAANPATATAAKAAPKSEAFLRLLHAYENMEPESAAKAVAGLAAKDKEAVVQMLLGWKPRTSGQILDALTQLNPGLAAELSYEVWKRSAA